MTLALYLLGTPRVELHQRVIKLGIKPMLVLAYLALEGRASRRDLAQLLWSNATDPLNSVSAARVSIRDVLKKLLEGDNETLSLKHGFYCDVNIFIKALESDQFQIWQAALELHQGVFLEAVRLPEWTDGFGADFEEWMLTWREKLEETKAELSWRLAKHNLSQAEFALAIPLLEVTQAPHLAPREDATRLLMLTAGALARPVRAQTAYAQLERRLLEELEVNPSAATKSALSLARSDPSSCEHLLRHEFKQKNPTISQSLGLEETNVPLFGREPELQILKNELHQVQTGQQRFVLLLGEPGVGKTRLAKESLRGTRGLAVQSGTASASGVALGLFERVVRQALNRQDITHFHRVWQLALAAFIPDTIKDTHLEPSKEHLFAAITALLQHPDRPTVLLLDDLQWADSTSLELILHLMHSSFPNGLLILATLRDTETPRSNLKSIWEIITREQKGIKLEIGGLNQKAVMDLTQTLGKQTDPIKLHKKSGGNPFFLLELLKSNSDNSQLHDLVKSRLANLTDTAQQLLEVSALIGDGSNLAMLRTISGRSLEEISQDLDELALTDVLHLQEDGTRFKHDLIREVVLEQIRPARKQILHLRAARALKPNQAANHALRCKDAWEENDTPKMLLSFLETGKQHSIRGDLPAALEWFEHADKNSRNATERLQALTERASALERYGRHEAALETLGKLAILEGSVTDPVLRSGAWLAKANLLALKMHRLEEAQVLVNQAFTALEGLSYSTAQLARSDALNIQGTIYRLEKKYVEAATAFEASLSIRQALEEGFKTADSLMNLAAVYSEIGNPQAEETHLLCLTIYQKLANDSGIARTYNNLGIHYTKQKQYDKALNSYQETIHLNHLVFNPNAETRAYLNIGVTHFYLENYDLARQNYEQAFVKAEILEDAEIQLLS
jgi:DNA-binding SARP family transcriptional activator/Tfp pilus assembly protein PilF